MVRERTGYRTLNRTRMVTGSGQPLFSKVQSFNIELLSSCSLTASLLLKYRERAPTAAQGPRGYRHYTHSSPVLRLKAVPRKKSFERGGNIQMFQFQQTAGEAHQGVTSLDGFRGQLSIYLSFPLEMDTSWR